MNQQEEWSYTKYLDEQYAISNLGQIKYYKNGEWKLLKPIEDKNGYLRVDLYKEGIATRYFIHRLVALCFIPNPNNNPMVSHKDGNKMNNTIWNLEWITEEARKERQSKTRKEKFKNGEYRKGYKKVSCYNLESGDFICEFESIRQAYVELKKANGGAICSCCKGKRKSAYNYYWSYEKKDNFFDE